MLSTFGQGDLARRLKCTIRIYNSNNRVETAASCG